MAESETHVAVSHEAEPEPEHEAEETAAAAAVATAGAAVALAQETAAHAELQAAEEIQEVAEEAEEWQTAIRAQVQEIGIGLASLSDRLSAIDSREEQRHQNDALLNERLSAIEAHPSLRSIPPASEAEEEETTASETEEENPLLGTEASANVGPAEVAGSASLANPIPSEREPERPKRKRHWI